MREIKFRAWDKNLKRMWSPEALSSLPISDFGREDLEWLQFTGLLDKNGKEIYEGDVVKNKNGCGVVEFGEWGYGEEDSDMNILAWKIKPPNNTPCDINAQTGNEVIGNIYENPELLTNK